MRFRRRVRAWQKVEVRSACVGWDARFTYIVQSMWKDGAYTSQVVYRCAVTDKSGIVPTEQLVPQLVGADAIAPEMPDWVTAWIASEDTRPWPPERV